MATDTEDRVQRLEYAIWGLRGDNGMAAEIRALRTELQTFIERENTRREAEASERLSSKQAVILALIAALFGLIGTVISVLVVLAQ